MSLDQEEIAQQLELLTTYRRTLNHLLQQAAAYGGLGFAPPQTANGIYEARMQIQQIKAILRTSSIVVEDLPNDGAPAPASIPSSYRGQVPSNRDWQLAASSQRNRGNKHRLVPELREFITDFCVSLDFIVIQDSYYVYHNQFVACSVRAPTLHLNLPNEFLLVLILEEEPSGELIRQLPDIPKMMNISTDFGLVFAPNSHRRVQLLVNDLIRPAMKNDLIVLGAGFLDEVANSTDPRTVLLRRILREVDLARVSPFMAGGSDLSDSMFFGREGELKNIAESIIKTSAAIVCGRRMGKTALLKRLARVVLPARKHICFFLDCQTVFDYHDLLREMATQWERSDLPFDPSQPDSFAKITAALAGPSHSSPIFLLDEIDTLLRYDSRNNHRLFRQLRTLSLGGRARFIMTGERSVHNQLGDAHSPLFNFCGLKVRLSFLDSASVTKLVLEPLEEMQIELHDPLAMVNTILNATSGHPYLVQRLCQELVLAISRQGVRIIGPERIEQVLDSSEYQDDYFETVWGQAPQLARVITMLIGSQGATLAQILERLGQHGLKPDPLEVEAALDVLDLYSVLARKSGRYGFVATAFPEMLRRAYGDDLEMNIALEIRRAR